MAIYPSMTLGGWMKLETVASVWSVVYIWCLCHSAIGTPHTLHEQERQNDNFLRTYLKFSSARKDRKKVHLRMM
jgi:hypothetical protein